MWNCYPGGDMRDKSDGYRIQIWRKDRLYWAAVPELGIFDKGEDVALLVSQIEKHKDEIIREYDELGEASPEPLKFANNKRNRISLIELAKGFATPLLLIIGLLVIVNVVSKIPSVVSGVAEKILASEGNKLIVVGLLVNNPEIYFKRSLLHEKEGRIQAAITDMELAIGLLQVKGADKDFKDKYYARLNRLKASCRDCAR